MVGGGVAARADAIAEPPLPDNSDFSAIQVDNLAFISYHYSG